MKATAPVKKIPYKTAFVVNTTSGGGHAGKTWPLVAEELDRLGQRYKVYFTRFAGDGIAMAEKAVADGAELIVAVGGDGTLREVVNGIDINKNIFALLPLGTGNGFRRACSLPGHWPEVIKGFTEWEPRLIDLGVINGSFFLNVVGIGFDAAVAGMASNKYKKLKGYAAYVAAFFDELKVFEHFCLEIDCPSWKIEQQKTLVVAIANGAFYGGGFNIAPHASIDDGELDLIIIRKQNSPETTLLAFQALVGKHLDNAAVIATKVTTLEINADHPVPVHLDGEVIGKLPVEIQIKPSALKLLAPS
jgi:diacylglycerol kinase (ATP)